MADRTTQDTIQGGDGIRTFPFPVDLSVLGVGMQVGPMSPDRTWHEDAPLERFHRIDFHIVMLFDDGPVTHMIDFAEYEAAAGDLLWIRPGQVHRFSRTTAYRGTVLTMQPGFLPRTTVEATGLYHYDLPPLLRPDAPQLAGLRAALAQLGREYEDTATLPIGLHTSVLRHSLTAFLLRLSHLATSSAQGREAGPTPRSPCSGTRWRRASPPTTASACTPTPSVTPVAPSSARCARRPVRRPRASSTNA